MCYNYCSFYKEILFLNLRLLHTNSCFNVGSQLVSAFCAQLCQCDPHHLG